MAPGREPIRFSRNLWDASRPQRGYDAADHREPCRSWLGDILGFRSAGGVPMRFVFLVAVVVGLGVPQASAQDPFAV